jgi:hypothetical protein
VQDGLLLTKARIAGAGVDLGALIFVDLTGSLNIAVKKPTSAE